MSTCDYSTVTSATINIDEDIDKGFIVIRMGAGNWTSAPFSVQTNNTLTGTYSIFWHNDMIDGNAKAVAYTYILNIENYKKDDSIIVNGVFPAACVIKLG